jgi:hypothetical protein
VYQTARGILADDIPVKAIAKISDKDVDYLFWFALYSTYSTELYDARVKAIQEEMQFRKEDGIEYKGIGQYGFPTFTGVNKLSRKQGEILEFLCVCELMGRRGKSASDFRIWLMDREEFLEEDIGTDPEYADKMGIIFSYRLYY